ncbi:MAG: type III pantothenate kinase [Chloroflexi bacterium]|nr:type III pantothenate kinase [Chloroflexota bacterium]
MLLAVDIGNTNIALGVYSGSELIADWRIATESHRMPDEYAMLLCNLLTNDGLPMTSIRRMIVSSVVPPLVTTFKELGERYFKLSPLVVGPGVKTGVRILYENPKEVGADRIVNALAAFRLYGGGLIVVDFGTATTFDAISPEGDYLGGAIAPGIGISSEALFKFAAKLPHVELTRPKTAVGKNTINSMQSGILFGYVGLVEGLINRFNQELGKSRVVATGGLAEVVAKETPTIDIINPRLTLEGLRLIYELNRGVESAGE